jgi:hypothetical protein
MVTKPLRRVFGRVRGVLFDPALYVTAFTFYAGVNRWITAEQLALCYGGTVLVTVLHQLWERRRWPDLSFPGELRSGALWGTALFAIGWPNPAGTSAQLREGGRVSVGERRMSAMVESGLTAFVGDGRFTLAA